MHTDNYNKKALVYDMVEMYRGYMDEIVSGCLAQRKFKTIFLTRLKMVTISIKKESNC